MTGTDKLDQQPIASLGTPPAGPMHALSDGRGESLSRVSSVAVSGPNPRRWDLIIERDAVAAVTGSETIAEVHIWERDELVILEFWVDGVDAPLALSVELVEQVFAHPAVQAHDPVLACVPRHRRELLEQACRHIEDARTRGAGMTCLIEGRVRNAATPAW